MRNKDRTPTRTAIEKYTEEEGVALYGVWGWLQCELKAQKTHDSSRHERNREKDRKYKERNKE